MKAIHLDHLVLTVSNIQRTVHFYTTILGMEAMHSEDGRVSLAFGKQKINLHLAGKEIAPKAGYPSTGSADLCFLVDSPVDRAISIIEGKGVSIIHGPVLREGAAGPINSVYIRDPDLNLIEVSFPA